MAQTAEKKTVGEGILQFMFKIRYVLIGTLVAGLLAVAAVIAYSAIEGGARLKAADALDEADQKYQAYSAAAEPDVATGVVDEAKKAEAEKAFLASVEAIAKKFPGRPAAQRALMMEADYYANAEKFAEAEKSYLKAADLAPKGYLTPASLQSAAVMAERAGDVDGAIKHLERVIADFKSVPTGLAHVYFSIGRLSETKKAYDKAVESYKKLEELFPFDNWTNLGKSRIITLKSQGLVP